MGLCSGRFWCVWEVPCAGESKAIVGLNLSGVLSMRTSTCCGHIGILWSVQTTYLLACLIVCLPVCLFTPACLLPAS